MCSTQGVNVSYLGVNLQYLWCIRPSSLHTAEQLCIPCRICGENETIFSDKMPNRNCDFCNNNYKTNPGAGFYKVTVHMREALQLNTSQSDFICGEHFVTNCFEPSGVESSVLGPCQLSSPEQSVSDMTMSTARIMRRRSQPQVVGFSILNFN